MPTTARYWTTVLCALLIATPGSAQTLQAGVGRIIAASEVLSPVMYGPQVAVGWPVFTRLSVRVGAGFAVGRDVRVGGRPCDASPATMLCLADQTRTTGTIGQVDTGLEVTLLRWGRFSTSAAVDGGIASIRVDETMQFANAAPSTGHHRLMMPMLGTGSLKWEHPDRPWGVTVIAGGGALFPIGDRALAADRSAFLDRRIGVRHFSIAIVRGRREE